jgi:hypothetical protein
MVANATAGLTNTQAGLRILEVIAIALPLLAVVMQIALRQARGRRSNRAQLFAAFPVVGVSLGVLAAYGAIAFILLQNPPLLLGISLGILGAAFGMVYLASFYLAQDVLPDREQQTLSEWTGNSSDESSTVSTEDTQENSDDDGN